MIASKTLKKWGSIKRYLHKESILITENMTLDDGARNTIFTCLGVKKGEKVLILVDSEKKKMGEAFFVAAVDAGAEAVMVKIMPSTRHGEEPPVPVAKLMTGFDAIAIATKYSMTHTAARRKATREGARIATMPGITEQILSEGSMIADYNEIAKTILRVHGAVKGKRKLKITTMAGTNLEMDTKGRAWVTGDTGICQERGDFITLPAGEIFIAPVEGSANGKLVIDGAFQKSLEEPVKVGIRKGYAEEFDGGEDVVIELDKRGKDARNIAEFGMGMNPTAKVVGLEIEDEKVLGTVHIAFGDNSTYGGKISCGIHISGIVREPTIVMDDSLTVMEKGVLKI
jgi:leucyl aminopeptidase (aminopeptidase T)